MHVARRQANDLTILDLSGRITLGDGSSVLRETVRTLLAGGSKKILLNLAGINQIDSSGLSELVSALSAAKSQRAEIKLLTPTAKVSEVLNITQLHTLFDILEDESAATAAFNS
jgi:anti-sigma B factor antagonist